MRTYHDIYDYGSTCGPALSQLCAQFRKSNTVERTDNSTGLPLMIYELPVIQSIDYDFDDFARLSHERVAVVDGFTGAGDFVFDTSYYYYEHYNLPKQTIYTSSSEVGYSVVHHYDDYGSLVKQTEEPTGNVLMSIGTDDWNLRGQMTSRTLYDNNQMVSNFDYYDSTGQISRINHGHLTGSQTFDYEYDAWGNIDSQTLNDSITEHFDYDELQRLVKSKVGSLTAIDYEYDNTIGLGNLIHKSDYADTQSYGDGITTGPNAIVSAELINNGGTITYQYDEKGNRVQDTLNGYLTSYAYDAHNLLIESTKTIDNSTIEFRYGVNNQRYFKNEESFDEDGNLSNREITLYAGPKFELVRNEATDETESKLHVNDYLTVTRKDNQELKRHFLQKDRLGSTTQILTDTGAQVSTKGYDAFGKPRDGDTWARMEPNARPALNFEDGSTDDMISTDITKRGFTDHEHIDNFELIHMNGRMYDFNNGRFLSVDPFIQGTTSQAINPYSYIQNNPLSGVDPTGYFVQDSFDCEVYDCGALLSGSSPKGAIASMNNGIKFAVKKYLKNIANLNPKGKPIDTVDDKGFIKMEIFADGSVKIYTESGVEVKKGRGMQPYVDSKGQKESKKSPSGVLVLKRDKNGEDLTISVRIGRNNFYNEVYTVIAVASAIYGDVFNDKNKGVSTL